MSMLRDKKLAKCDLCGSLISGGVGSSVCRDCWDKDEEMFQKVKSAIKFGQKVLPDELAAKTGIDVKHINRWVLNGRFG